MKKFILILFSLIVLFGCIGGSVYLLSDLGYINLDLDFDFNFNIKGFTKSNENNEDSSSVDVSSSSNEVLTCTKSETDEDGYTTEISTVVSVEDGYVVKIKETTLAEMDSEYIDLSLEVSKVFIEAFNELDGFEGTCTKESDTTIKTVISLNYEEIDIEQWQEFLESEEIDEDEFEYNFDSLELDEFKSNYLEGYTCK